MISNLKLERSPLFFLFLLILLFQSFPVFAYRPFVSTDAAVADPQEMEMEFGYFNFRRSEGKNIFIFPKFVFNYGIVDRLEGVGEFAVENSPDGQLHIVDPALSFKTVVKKGFLQEKKGPSFAIETSLLLPSNFDEEKKIGFEGIAILGIGISRFTFYFNLGGGVDRIATQPFMVWGTIGELLVRSKLWLVGEVNGEKGKDISNNISGLLGFIWQSPQPRLFFDAGIRRGMTQSADRWQATAGLTVNFPLPSHGPRLNHSNESYLN
jgi:hypothetical protein